MDESEIPRATHESSLTLAGVAIRTYVLEDGRRLLNSDDTQALLRALEGGVQLNPDEVAAYAEFVGRGSKG